MGKGQDIPLTLNADGYSLLAFPSPDKLAENVIPKITSGLAFLHADCILTDHTMATFLPPLSHSLMQRYRSDNLVNADAGKRVTWVILAPIDSRTNASPSAQGKAQQAFTGQPYPTIAIANQDCEVAGVVSLSLPASQTGPFRSLVEKLLVSPFHRRKGFARYLMKALEEKAWELGRWNILLDTVVGSEAESVYPRLGYKKGLVIERYGYSPEDGREMDEVWFWKDLRWEKGEEVKHKNGRDLPVVEL